MKSLLEALKEGRLIELPDDSDKEDALELLAHLIEAVPDLGSTADILASVLEREKQANTGIGRGVACPHSRTALEGELLCAVGWSPKGIEYGAADGRRVHLIVMYHVPDDERNTYLKEISGLAKAVSSGDTIESISSLPDIHTAREKLLDWVALAINEAMPETKARMIKLEAKQAAAALGGAGALKLIPFRLIAWPGGSVVLSQDPVLAEVLEAVQDLPSRIVAERELETAGWRIAMLSETPYSRDRREFEAVALKNG